MENILKIFKNLTDALNVFFASLHVSGGQSSSALASLPSSALSLYTSAVRFVLPVLAVLILLRCMLPALAGHNRRSSPWGYLQMPTGERLPLRHWENSIGRSRLSDIVIPFPFISRSHAVLTRREGDWLVSDLDSRGGVKVNGKKISGQTPVNEGDILLLAGLELKLLPAMQNVDSGAPERIYRPRTGPAPGVTLLLLVVFQLLGCLQLFFTVSPLDFRIPAVFLLLVLLEFVHFEVSQHFGPRETEKPFELELLAYFLCGLGFFVVAAASPRLLVKQLIAVAAGVAVFYLLVLLLRDLDRAQKLKIFFLGTAIALCALNLIAGQVRNGAKNWISLGFVTFQPMEFVKVAFVLAGTATLDRLLTTRNLTSFLAFSGICVGTLALTKDFGTALVFFCAFLVIAFMRSGDIRTIALISAGAGLAGLAVISFMPYVASRFSSWGHVWQYADSSGYQQTRTMVAAASGGLLGLGGGNGYLVKIGAASTDLVFGVLTEEWGLIIALAAVSCVAFYSLFAILSVGKCRSSFYAISSCGAASMFLMQTALNMLGSVDILPLTGVTMPFVSNGGSSVIACWCLLAFIKSADERNYRSVRAPEKQPAGAARRRTGKRRVA